MKNINNKGFTLVEVIAVVAILAVLLILLIPNVSNLLNKGENDAYDSLKQSILVAANDYVKDNRYDIVISGNVVSSIGGKKLEDGRITVGILLELGYLSPTGTDSSGDYIVNPKNRSERLDLGGSYVEVTFNSSKKDYEFILKDSYLDWE